MATYVMNQTAPNLLTFVIVPVEANKSFGSLYEINSRIDEISQVVQQLITLKLLTTSATRLKFLKVLLVTLHPSQQAVFWAVLSVQLPFHQPAPKSNRLYFPRLNRFLLKKKKKKSSAKAAVGIWRIQWGSGY